MVKPMMKAYGYIILLINLLSLKYVKDGVVFWEKSILVKKKPVMHSIVKLKDRIFQKN